MFPLSPSLILIKPLLVPLLVLSVKSPVPLVVNRKSVLLSPATIVSVAILTLPVPFGVMFMSPLTSVELIVLPFKSRLSIVNCVNPAIAVVVLPKSKVLDPSVILFALTAPLLTVKFAVAKLAAPFVVVVASAILNVILLLAGTLVVLMAPTPSRSKVSVNKSIVVFVPLSPLMFKVVTGLAQVAFPAPSLVKT